MDLASVAQSNTICLSFFSPLRGNEARVLPRSLPRLHFHCVSPRNTSADFPRDIFPLPAYAALYARTQHVQATAFVAMHSKHMPLAHTPVIMFTFFVLGPPSGIDTRSARKGREKTVLSTRGNSP